MAGHTGRRRAANGPAGEPPRAVVASGCELSSRSATLLPRGQAHAVGLARRWGGGCRRRSWRGIWKRRRGRSMTTTPSTNGARRPVTPAAATRAAPDWDLVRKRNNVEKLKFEKHPIRLIDEL